MSVVHWAHFFTYFLHFHWRIRCFFLIRSSILKQILWKGIEHFITIQDKKLYCSISISRLKRAAELSSYGQRKHLVFQTFIFLNEDRLAVVRRSYKHSSFRSYWEHPTAMLVLAHFPNLQLSLPRIHVKALTILIY